MYNYILIYKGFLSYNNLKTIKLNTLNCKVVSLLLTGVEQILVDGSSCMMQIVF